MHTCMYVCIYTYIYIYLRVVNVFEDERRADVWVQQQAEQRADDDGAVVRLATRRTATVLRQEKTCML